jgi:hypothetical protein
MVVRRLMVTGFVCVGLCVVTASAWSTTCAIADDASAIPPIVLQGCDEKVKAKHWGLFSNGVTTSAGGHGDQVVGFDVSFVNTTTKTASVVLLRIGSTDFAKTGTFSPGATIAWRLAAAPGPCSIKAVRFTDGSEWDAPPQTTSAQSPAPEAFMPLDEQ